MVNLSLIPGCRLRSVATAALVVGVMGAFTSGYAHAAVQPAPITGTVAVTVSGTPPVGGTTTGGSLIVSVDNGTVTFDGTAGTASGGVFDPVASAPALVVGTVTSSNLSFTSANGGGTCTTADVVQADTTLKVNADGSDTVSATCNVPGAGQVILTLVVSANGVPTSGGGSPTPELGSGDLLAVGLLPLGAILYYRRRRAQGAKQR